LACRETPKVQSRRAGHARTSLARARDLSEEPPGRRGVIDVGGRDDHGQQQPHGIHDDMALATPDLLAAVGADLLAAAVGLDRLAVDAGARLGECGRTAALRRRTRRRSMMRSQVSSRFQASKWL
jgi:hypothetical protein